jgi:hypothetical protein
MMACDMMISLIICAAAKMPHPPAQIHPRFVFSSPAVE